MYLLFHCDLCPQVRLYVECGENNIHALYASYWDMYMLRINWLAFVYLVIIFTLILWYVYCSLPVSINIKNYNVFLLYFAHLLSSNGSGLSLQIVGSWVLNPVCHICSMMSWFKTFYLCLSNADLSCREIRSELWRTRLVQVFPKIFQLASSANQFSWIVY